MKYCASRRSKASSSEEISSGNDGFFTEKGFHDLV
jgi:hypothetical protein